MADFNVSLDLSTIADADLTAALAGRYQGLGRNMPRSANEMRDIVPRLVHVLENGGLTAAKRGGVRVVYYGKMASGPRRPNVVGGLAPLIKFRFAEDGIAIAVLSLETCDVRWNEDENFVVERLT
jgi:hypothetical protein